ncbi:MAG: hypothetical protein ACRELV_15305 [Longimicrobiales bacterium]
MILPNVRASFGRAEAGAILGLLCRGDAAARGREEERLRDDGFDALLDDPRTLNALLTAPGLSGVPARLIFYLIVRHALLECAVIDRRLADYLAALLLEFGHADRARQPAADGQRLDYLVDIVAAIDAATGRERFLLQAHLGNFALWLSGLFPDRLLERVRRRGAPGIEYYEEMGRTGFRAAADTADAARYGIDEVLAGCAEEFPALRVSLNRMSDRWLFPRRGDPVGRLLRQVEDEFNLRQRPR